MVLKSEVESLRASSATWDSEVYDVLARFVIGDRFGADRGGSSGWGQATHP